MEQLLGIVTSGQEGFDRAFLLEALLERMKEDSPEVVAATLKALEVSGWNIRLSGMFILESTRITPNSSYLSSSALS